MDEKLFKQRIVGAIVLVALAVIFIPMLLPGKGDNIFKEAEDIVPVEPENLKNLRVLELDNPIPAPPPREVVRTPVDRHTPAEPQKNKQADKDVAEKQVETQVPKPASEMRPLKPPAKAWAVQVGSFSQRRNAMRLRDKLRGKGYSSFVEKLDSHDKVIYRVRVGPEVQRKKALTLQKDIQTRLKIQGMVVSHP